MTIDGSTHRTSRVVRMTAELQAALGALGASDLETWGRQAAARVPRVFGRRAATLAGTLASVGLGAVSEVRAAAEARGRGELSAHLSSRGERALESARELGNAAILTVGTAADVASRLRADPAGTAPLVLGAALGFLAPSGPATPGTGATNGSVVGKVLGNSVLFGGTAESLVFATMELATLVKAHLPEPHDPLWDELASAGARLGHGLAAGVGAVAPHGPEETA